MSRWEAVVVCPKGHETTTPILHAVETPDGAGLQSGLCGSDADHCAVCDELIAAPPTARRIGPLFSVGDQAVIRTSMGGYVPTTVTHASPRWCTTATKDGLQFDRFTGETRRRSTRHHLLTVAAATEEQRRRTAATRLDQLGLPHLYLATTWTGEQLEQLAAAAETIRNP